MLKHDGQCIPFQESKLKTTHPPFPFFSQNTYVILENYIMYFRNIYEQRFLSSFPFFCYIIAVSLKESHGLHSQHLKQTSLAVSKHSNVPWYTSFFYLYSFFYLHNLKKSQLFPSLFLFIAERYLCRFLSI